MLSYESNFSAMKTLLFLFFNWFNLSCNFSVLRYNYQKRNLIAVDSSIIEKKNQNNNDDKFIETSVLQSFYLTAFQFVKTAF